jgi:hypothetical protein
MFCSFHHSQHSATGRGLGALPSPRHLHLDVCRHKTGGRAMAAHVETRQSTRQLFNSSTLQLFTLLVCSLCELGMKMTLQTTVNQCRLHGWHKEPRPGRSAISPTSTGHVRESKTSPARRRPVYPGYGGKTLASCLRRPWSSPSIVSPSIVLAIPSSHSLLDTLAVPQAREVMFSRVQ